ncbi:MAG: 3'(2'),5'-bisphosphate nucleotidase [Pirellulales bacterium]
MDLSPFSSPEAQFAVEAVREASLLARRVQAEMISGALTKDDRSPVTVADFAVQAVIAHRLAESLPGSILVGEEQSAALQLEEGLAMLDQVTHFVRSSLANATPEEVCGLIDRGRGEPAAGSFWTLDPIDGTKGFLRREQYAVALALVRDGNVELGVLGCPDLVEGLRPAAGGPGSLVAAARGKGTWVQPLAGDSQWQRLTVSPERNASAARLLRSVEKSHTNTDRIGQLLAALGTSAASIPMDSQAKYAVLAAGGAEILVRLLSPSRPDYAETIWDQAAGSIVISEAGGRVSDLDGKSLDFSHGRRLLRNRGVLATNGHLHEAVLAALRSVSA